MIAVVAILCAGLFAGAALYITLVEHPASVGLGARAAVRFFGPMYARAAPLQASLALVGTLAALWTWGAGDGILWLAGAVLLGAVIPFTVVVIAPTNARLEDPVLDPDSPDTAALLARWARLHAVRTIASVLAFLVLVVALAGA